MADTCIGAWQDVRTKKEKRKSGGGGGGGDLHHHDSGIAIALQQSQKHSLTASPNNQLRAQDRSQQRREKSPRASRSWVDVTALLWIPIQVSRWQLTALDHVSTSSCYECPLVNLEQTSVSTCRLKKKKLKWSERLLRHFVPVYLVPFWQVQKYFLLFVVNSCWRMCCT